MSTLSKTLIALVILQSAWIVWREKHSVSEGLHYMTVQAAYRDGVMDERGGKVIEE